MASLSQALRQQKAGTLKRGPGGQLSEETTEEVQQLAGQAGLQAPPTTAVGTGMIGGTPKQQDMAGSKAQKEAAISIAQQPTQMGLSGAVRLAQSRSQMTGQEQGQKEKSQDMQNLGALGDRVTGFIEVQKQKLQAQAQAATAQNTLAVNTQDVFQGKDVSSIKSKLEQFRREPNNQQLLLEINQALGYDVNTQLSPEQVNDLYESATDTIARGAAGNVDDDLTVQDLVAQGNLGYTPTELSELLGVPESTLTGMTVGQLRSEIERVGQQEFSNTQDLEQKAQSGLLGQAERQQAQLAAREMSSTGVRATEADYANIESQIQNADRVTFGGKEYQVDELLQDDTISGIIKEYLDSAENSPLRTQLEQSEPALMEFINKNKAVLQEASSAMQAGAGEFQEIQKANKQLTNIEGIELDKSIAEKLIPGFGQLQAARIDTSSIPFYQALEAMPSSNRRQQAVNALNLAQDTYPDVAEQLQGLNAEQITNLNIGKAGSNFDKWLGSRQLRDRVSAISPSDTNALIQEAFSNITPEGFKELQRESRNFSAFGLDTGLGIDINNTSNLKQEILSATPEISMADASTGNIASYEKKSVGQLKFPKDPIVANLMEFAKPYSTDGKLDKDEIAAISARVSQNSEEGLRWLMKLEDLAHNPKANMDTQAVIQQRFKLTNANTDRAWASVLSGQVVSDVNSLAELLKSDSRVINPVSTKSKIGGIVNDAFTNALENGITSGTLDAAIRAIQIGDSELSKSIRNNPKLDEIARQITIANRDNATYRDYMLGKIAQIKGGA